MIILMFAVCVVYLGYVIWKCGVLPSISDSWYELPGNQKHLFTLFILGLGIPLAEYGYDHNNIWFFSAGALLTVVGIAAEFKKKSVGIVHVFGAVGSIALSLYGLARAGHEDLVVFTTIGVMGVKYLDVENETWWVEKICIACILIGLTIIEYGT